MLPVAVSCRSPASCSASAAPSSATTSSTPSTWATARSTGCRRRRHGGLSGPAPKVVVGDPVAAGIVAKPVYVFLQILQGSGRPDLRALGLIFAIGVALGLAKNDGVSALAATVGYLVMNGTMGVVAGARGIKTATVLGLETLDTSVFGGILIGIIAGYMFNRFYRIKLPPYLGFFAGKRFVPIVTAFAAIALGVVLAFVWPPIGYFIQNTGQPGRSARTPRRRLRLRPRRARPAALRPAPHLERAVLLHHQHRRLGGLQRHPDLLLPRAPGVRHPRRRLPGQDVRPVRRGAGDLAGREAGEPGPHRLDHARRRP